MMITRLICFAAVLTAILNAETAPLIDNAQVTVYRTDVAPHRRFDVHAGKSNCVLIALDPVEIRLKGRAVPLILAAGQARWMPAQTARSGEVVSSRPATLVSVVLKKAGDPRISVTGPLDPVRVDPKHYRVEFENDQVRVVRARIGPGESTPVHEHKSRRVIAFLTPQDFRVTNPGGQVDSSKGQTGDVRLGGTAKHSEQNVGDVPFEVVVVELKLRD